MRRCVGDGRNAAQSADRLIAQSWAQAEHLEATAVVSRRLPLEPGVQGLGVECSDSIVTPNVARCTATVTDGRADVYITLPKQAAPRSGEKRAKLVAVQVTFGPLHSAFLVGSAQILHGTSVCVRAGKTSGEAFVPGERFDVFVALSWAV